MAKKDLVRCAKQKQLRGVFKMLLSDFLKFLELNRKQDYEVHYIDKEGNEVESYFIDLDTEVKEFKYSSSYRYEEGSMSY